MKDGDMIKELRSGITINKFLDLVILIADDYYDDLEDLAKEYKVHLIKIKNLYLDENDMLTKNYFFKSLMIYNTRTPPKDNFLDLLKKEKRKRIKKLSEELDIEIKPLTKEDYLLLLKIYEEMIIKKEKGRIYANEDWFDTRIQDPNKELYGLFAYHNNKLVGGTILVTSIYEGKKLLNSAFKAASFEWIKKGIFDFLAYHFINGAKTFGSEQIRSGADNNFYGYHLSTGLFLFKREWGFFPDHALKFEFMKIINDELFTNPYFFFSGKEERKMELFIKGDVNITQIEKQTPFPINVHEL